MSRPPAVLLASASPRRHQLLQVLGWSVLLHPTDVDETRQPEETAAAMVRRLAHDKAVAAFRQLRTASPQRLARTRFILGADTTVEVKGRILGKPTHRDEARRFLHWLRDGSHNVHSAVCLVDSRHGRTRTFLHTARVCMRPYSDAEIEAYLKTGSHLDKAGAYALQDPDFAPVARVEGCPAGVMGLPLGEVARTCAAWLALPCARDFAAECHRLTGYACCQAAAS